ncbi:MAG: hypothetical protein EOP45_11095 [Sphingobacteriaceae bacterium]|nr:MAG: hypothetical protein EOP45_11095 [Sphingobacteriaceae bacterium]
MKGKTPFLLLLSRFIVRSMSESPMTKPILDQPSQSQSVKTNREALTQLLAEKNALLVEYAQREISDDDKRKFAQYHQNNPDPYKDLWI